MKYKRSLAIILIIITAIALYTVNNILPFALTKSGKAAFYKNHCVKAFWLFRASSFINNKNPDTRYYYAKTLIMLKPTLEVQQELFKISELDLPDSADLIADKQIEKWRSQIFFNAGKNYIEQVPSDGKIIRWDATKFPLKVCIKSTDETKPPKYYEQSIRKAFLQWQVSTKSFIKFIYVTEPFNSQILVTIEPSSAKVCSGENCKYVVAYTTPQINGELLEKMNIIFYDKNNLGQPFSEREVYNTALHEIGHTLGIMGHSYNKDDLMYMESNTDETFDKYRSDFQLITSTDLNTLGLLYRLIPNITNTALSEYDTSRQFFAPIVIGTKSEITSRKMLEAENYIQSAPNLPNGYIDLSSAYTEQRKYNEALEALNKALELSSNNNEKYIVYYNMAVAYMNVQTWDEALKYAQMAKELQPDSDINGIIAAIYYNKGNKAVAKQIYIESLKLHPENTIDAINLARIYVQELNLVSAGKTLNKLIKANPGAAADPRVQAFNILIFLFK